MCSACGDTGFIKVPGVPYIDARGVLVLDPPSYYVKCFCSVNLTQIITTIPSTIILRTITAECLLSSG